MQKDITGIIVIGGTRTAYILEKGSESGRIDDFQDYANYSLKKYKQLINNYIQIGGKNLILPALSWQSFIERGEKYTNNVAESIKMLTYSEMHDFYNENNIQPRFVGLEPLLTQDNQPNLQSMALYLQNYQQNHNYNDDAYQLIWEIAPIPLLTFGQASLPNMEGLGLKEIQDTVYRYYSKVAYGIELPVPTFYIGSARNGDIKLRSMYPLALTPGADTKFYFLKYPSLLITKEALSHIFDDAKQVSNSKQYDYTGLMDATTLRQLKQQFQTAINNVDDIIGLSS